MTTTDLLRLRLRHQQLSETQCRRPQDVVATMVAMQAQEYAMAKWAVGLRLPDATEADVERAFNAGAILRTHVLRPTWHFVTPADIRWLLALTAPRVHAVNAVMYRQLELDPAVLRRGCALLVEALQGGRSLARASLTTALARIRLTVTGQRLGYLLMYAELEGIICSGPREGRQFTYALLEERVPTAPKLDRAEALAELSRRYFASRGPATARDFAYWSGLTLTEARTGVATLGPEFERETINGEIHLFLPGKMKGGGTVRSTFLMPDYDEYGASYQERSALHLPVTARKRAIPEASAFNRMIIVDGRIAGSWRRSLGASTVEIKTDFTVKLSPAQLRAVGRATQRFGAFIGKNTGI